jgi:hypothetical protein
VDRQSAREKHRSRWRTWVPAGVVFVWTALMIWFYVATVRNSCSDPEQDCGLAIGLGFGMAAMIWLAGALVIALAVLAVRVVSR